MVVYPHSPEGATRKTAPYPRGVPKTLTPVVLDSGSLSIESLCAVARHGACVSLSAEARARVTAARAGMLARASQGEALYGINTGFGSFANVRLPAAQLAQLQTNIIRSHACGVGDALDVESVRAMMIVLAASLARAHSGVRAAVIDSLIAHLNLGLTPVVPSRGSVGASGDLAPLAHIAQGLMGEGMMIVNDTVIAAEAAHRAAAIGALTLAEKEGLALINGTHLMSALGALAVTDVQHLMHAALVANAMALDGCRAATSVLDERIHAVRKQPGQQRVAAILANLTHNSQIGPAHAAGDPRVQDPYALRASPQVLGAVLDAVTFVRDTVERELGAVTDNPLVFARESSWDVLSGANFHGMPLAIALDLLKIALSHLAGIAERRIYWALSGHDRENKLPAHLSAHPGINSGFMIVQYAAAACCNELRTLAYPSSVGNISTCAGIEDYNSMGATSALHAREAIRIARDVIACELLVMAQAIDIQRPLLSGAGVEHAHRLVRTVVKPLDEDRSPAPDIAAISQLIASGALVIPEVDLT